MEIECGDHNIQNAYDYYDNYNNYSYYILQELRKLLNNFLLDDTVFYPIQNEKIKYQQQSLGSVTFDFIYWRILFYLRFCIEFILKFTIVFQIFRDIIFVHQYMYY